MTQHIGNGVSMTLDIRLIHDTINWKLSVNDTERKVDM